MAACALGAKVRAARKLELYLVGRQRAPATVALRIAGRKQEFAARPR